MARGAAFLASSAALLPCHAILCVGVSDRQLEFNRKEGREGRKGGRKEEGSQGEKSRQAGK